MLPLAACLITQQFTFGGGTENQFLDSIAKESGSDYVLLADQSPNIVKGKFKYDSQAEFARRCRQIFKLGPTNAGSRALSRDYYPDGFYRLDQFASYKESFSKPKKGPVIDKDGNFSAKTAGNDAIALPDLRKLEWKKAIRYDRVFDRAYLRFSISELDQDSTMQAIADAVGAKLITSSSAYELKIDPFAFRTRATGYYNRVLSDKKFQNQAIFRAEAEYMIASLPVVKDDTISKSFADPANTDAFTKYWTVLPKLHRSYGLAVRRALALIDQMDQNGRSFFLSTVDDGGDICATIRDDGRVRVLYVSGDKSSRIEL